ncbi:hypothetical protein EV368DRAFT_2562, partial [Lentinula lateritia]
CANSADAIPFLRAYASTGTDHFYTTNSTEMNNAQGSYSFEGDAAFLWSTQEASTVPLYRLFNQNLNDHFYTMDANESNEALASGYTFDTDSHIAGYVYPYSICGASPIYRLYSSTLADHFYTLSQNESANAAGYVLEGIAGFALLPSADGQPQTATVSASPLLLPTSLDPSPISISSTFVAAYSTTIDMDPVSTSPASKSGNKAIVRSGVSCYGFLSILISGLVATWTAGIAGFAILPAANGNVVQGSAVPYLLPSAVTASPESQVSASPSSSCANNADAIPLLRAFSSTGKDHFYTTNSTEMNGVAIAQDAYSFEGDATFLWSTQETSTVPLYRLYSLTVNDHFYTIDANETSEAIASGYAFDTDSHIAGYVYPYSICGASPMYRLYSSSSSDHFYTMSQAESQSASASGYILEGIAGFALLPSVDGQPQTVTVSASPLLLPASLEPSAVSIPSSS